MVDHQNLHLSGPFLFTLRFCWTENLAGKSSGELIHPKINIEFYSFNFFFFLRGTHTRHLGVK